MNNVSLVGVLGADAKIVVDKENFTVSMLSLATKDRAKENDQWVNITDWHSIKLINRKNLIPYLTKGVTVAIKGKLKVEKYTGADNVTKYKHFVLAEEIELLSSKQNQAQANNTTPSSNNIPDNNDFPEYGEDTPMY